jgi:hypothetical protein
MVEIEPDGLDDELRQFVKRVISTEDEIGGVVLELKFEMVLLHGTIYSPGTKRPRPK